MDDHTMQNMV